MNAAFAGLLLLASAAPAATSVKVKRGDLKIQVKVTGTVVPDGVFRLRSPIEGRVESVATGVNEWKTSEQTLAVLAHKEFAAMLDAKGSQAVEILEDRWANVLRPTPVRCQNKCFILKSFLKPKTWVKADSVMFEAATSLKLVGRVRPEDVPWIRDGQELVFWPVKEPKRLMKGRVTRFILDIQGEKAVPAATFTLTLSSDRPIDAGAEWEGRIVPFAKQDVLYVPTAALIRAADGVYLPVRVSTGLTTQELTEISAGVEDKRDVLVLDDADLLGVERHQQEVPSAAPPAPARNEPVVPMEEPVPYKKRRHTTVDDPDTEETPYAEP